jgi:heptosyltransferase III
MKTLKKIILSRTDSIGDVVLTLPMAGALKQCFPDCAILFLGSGYTAPVIRACEHVDAFINWDEVKDKPDEQASFLAALGADAIVHVFPRKEIADAAHRAKIPLRLGTSHRWFHWLTCNRLVHLSRKSSDLHESQLNLELLRPLGVTPRFTREEIPALYGLTRLQSLPEEFSKLIDAHKFNLVLHPKSKGSAKEWGEENFAKLIAALPREKFELFITGSEAEGRLVRSTLVQPFPFVTDLTGKLTLDELMRFIAAADGLLACSTGPLHLAAALGKVAVGLYASRRPLHPGRWSPLGKHVVVIEDGRIERYDGNLAISVERVVAELTGITDLRIGKTAGLS